MTAVLIPMTCWKGQVFPASWGCKQYDVQPEQNGFLLMEKSVLFLFVLLVAFAVVVFFFFNPC